MFLILGYYHKYNLGDEAYKLCIPKILGVDPEECIFLRPDDPFDPSSLKKIDGIVFGGGDIVNDYFHERFSRFHSLNVMKIGLSVGIPYPNLIHLGHIDHLDHVFIRNKTDLALLDHRIGSQYSHYLPDAVFVLDTKYFTLGPKTQTIGIFPVGEMDHDHIKKLCSGIKVLLKNDYKVIVYKFDTSETDQDDQNSVNTIYKHCPEVTIDNTRYTVKEMITNISKLSGALCVRFHAHIFCTMLGIPFVSYGKTRKTKLYLEENDLDHLDYSKISNNLSQDKVLKILKSDDLPDKLLAIYRRNNFLLKTSQVRNLFFNNDHRIVKNMKSCDEVHSDIIRLCRKKYSNNPDHDKLSVSAANCLAQTISMEITGDPESKYVYGTVDNLINHKCTIKEMIKWIMNDYNNNIDFTGVNINYMTQIKDHKIHRSGWNYVVSELEKYNNPKGILLDTFMDRTFHWCDNFLESSGVIPYTSRWIGFIHHTPLEWYTDYNVTDMFKNPDFLRSLETCQSLIVLSDYLKNIVLGLLKPIYPKVPVHVLYHPTEFAKTKFSFRKFDQNERSIVQIGAWMRDSLAIYQLKVDKSFVKEVLKGHLMENYFLPDKWYFSTSVIENSFPNKRNLSISSENYPDSISRQGGNTIIRLLNKWLYDQSISNFFITDDPELATKVVTPEMLTVKAKINEMIASVKLLEHLNNRDYDDLLSHTAVFVKLFDASAVNTVIECAVRNTPIFVNNHPAIREILGDNYPLYFNDLDDATRIITPENVKAGYVYLKKMNKDRLKIETFMDDFLRIVQTIGCS